MGMVSTEFTPLDSVNLEKLLERSEEQSNIDDVFESLEELRSILSSILKASKISSPGLISVHSRCGMSDFLDWPSTDCIEAYAITLPAMIQLSDANQHGSQLRNTLGIAQTAEDDLLDLRRTLAENADTILQTIEERNSETLARLEERIEHLQQEVTNLEFRVTQTDKKSISEIERVLKARKTALERDRKRQADIVGDVHEIRERYLSILRFVDAEFDLMREDLRHFKVLIDELTSPSGTADIPPEGAIMMVPFFIVGFTSKGKLEVELHPPSILHSTGEHVSRRRDFIDVLHSSSEAMEEMQTRLQDRISKDISLRKFMRSSSESKNLLSLKTTRKLIHEGASGLVADGLVKQSMIGELDSILTLHPETTLPRGIKIPTRLADEDLCQVRIHVYDDAGQPVEHATIDLGIQSLISNARGLVKTSLPLSRYDATVSAAGYKNQSIEFTLTSSSDTVIPIRLVPLPAEERMKLMLEELVGRAERIDSVRERLWDAFEEHGGTLLGIPSYRSALKELLTELGYDPETWIAQANKRKGMVKRLLKRDDRTDGIRRDILKLAEDSKQSGGIMLLSDLLVKLDDKGWETVPDEIQSILDDMRKDGLIQGVTKMKSGSRFVQFVPVALTEDPNQILELAAENDGSLTIEDAVLKLGWTEERVKNALDLLVSRGVAKMQKTYSSGVKYWFPGLREGKK
jgi:hypothetical protein